MTEVVVDAVPGKQQQHAETIARVMLAADSDLYLHRGRVFRFRQRLSGAWAFEEQKTADLRVALQQTDRPTPVVALGARGPKALPSGLIEAAVRLFEAEAVDFGREVVAVIKFPAMVRDGARWAAMRDMTPGVRAGVAVTPSPKAAVVPTLTGIAEFLDAVRTLMCPLEEFIFPSPEHRALALAAMLTAATRPTMRTAPLVVIEAAQPRSGKSLLAEVVCAMVPGRDDVDQIAAGVPESVEEFDKRLMAWAERPATLLDNLRHRLASGTLEACIVAGALDVRQAGQWASTETVVTRSMLALTGNNAALSDDLRWRSLNIRLGGDARPQDRPHSFNPLERIAERRGEFSAAAISVLDYAQGGPRERWLRDVAPDFADLIAPAVRLACEVMPAEFAWPERVVDDAVSSGGQAELVDAALRGLIAEPDCAEQSILGMLTSELLTVDAMQPIRDHIEARTRGSRKWGVTTLGGVLRNLREVPGELGRFVKRPKRTAGGTEKWAIELSEVGQALLAERRAQVEAERERYALMGDLDVGVWSPRERATHDS